MTSREEIQNRIQEKLEQEKERLEQERKYLDPYKYVFKYIDDEKGRINRILNGINRELNDLNESIAEIDLDFDKKLQQVKSGMYDLMTDIKKIQEKLEIEKEEE